jgi:hypothetical protein
MKSKAAKFLFAAGMAILFSLAPNLLRAQAATSLSGTITDSSGKGVPGATVSVKSAETGQTVEVQADAAGKYSVPQLAPGDYTVSISAQGFAVKASKVTVTGAGPQTMDLVLSAGSAQQGSGATQPTTTPLPELPNAPSSTSASPSLSDLGFTPQQTQANTQLQAMLEKRTEMLKIHQRLGLITAIPMAAAVITGPYAKAKGKNGQTITEPTTANLDFHAALGGATTGLYFATAYYAIRAPRVPGTTKHGAIRVHEALAFIHGPGMILTPILGIMAYKQENAGEKVHGIASVHGAVAYTTAAAYGASIVAVSWPIHLKFWERQ